MPFAQVGTIDPHKLYYETHGNGSEKVLMIMGFGCPSRAWQPQVDFFKSKKEFEICIFDNRGVGRSDCPGGFWTTRKMAEDCMELLDHLGWQKAHIVGLSMGGMIALNLAILLEKRMLSLSLAVTHCGLSTPTLHGLRGMIMSAANQGDLERQAEAAIANTVADATMGHHEKPSMADRTMRDEMIKLLKETIDQDPPISVTAYMKQLGAVMTHRISTAHLREIRKLRVPILILCGTDDHIVKHTNSHLLKHHLPEAELVEIADAGHFINVECAEQFSSAVLRTFHRARQPHVISLNTHTTIRVATESLTDDAETSESDDEDGSDGERKSSSVLWTWSFLQRWLGSKKMDEESHSVQIEATNKATTTNATSEFGLQRRTDSFAVIATTAAASVDDVHNWAVCSDPSLVL